jgi:hypothetical protein
MMDIRVAGKRKPGQRTGLRIYGDEYGVYSLMVNQPNLHTHSRLTDCEIPWVIDSGRSARATFGADLDDKKKAHPAVGGMPDVPRSIT